LATTHELSTSPARWSQPVAALPGPTRSGFRAALTGASFAPGEDGYEAACRLWNGVVTRRPGLVVRATTVEDVQRCLDLVTRHDLALAVRAGGHGVAGDALCDDGLVIDVSAMKHIEVDAPSSTASVGAGLTWGELDRATGAFGLATTGGQISTTGVAGLTLGGGLGWLMRHHGLTVDNLLAVDLVTPDGRYRRTDAEEEPDLFWALRGGGGNFGVATRFSFRLHPVDEVYAGTLVYPAARAAELLARFHDVAAQAPDELTLMAYFLPAMDSDLLPASARGEPAFCLAVCATAPPGAAEAVVTPLRTGSPPLADTVRWQPYVQLQSMFDFSAPFGLAAYWKSHYLADLPEPAIETVVAHAGRVTSPLSQVLLTTCGGAAARVDELATATGHRDAPYVLEILAKWPDGPGETHERWADEFWQAARPWSTGGAYVNFLGDEPDRVAAAYPDPILRRLREVKREVDPDNLLHRNRNFLPAA
jgi:FAD/FMN-containing dehydrogenase